MIHVDYTHPDKVPQLFLPHDRRSSEFYLRLDELPPGHQFYSRDWVLFRHPEYLEGGSAWIQSNAILQDLLKYGKENGLMESQVRPVVGSGDPAYDEALAQSLRIRGLSPLVAELVLRNFAAPDNAVLEED